MFSRKQLYNEKQREINEAYSALRAAMRHNPRSKIPSFSESKFADMFTGFADNFSDTRSMDFKVVVAGAIGTVGLLFLLTRIFSAAGRTLFTFSPGAPQLLLLAVATAANVYVHGSEHADLVMFASTPVYLSAALLVVSSVVQAASGVVQTIMHHILTIALCIVGSGFLFNPVSIMFSRCAAVCFLLAAISLRLYLGHSVVIALAAMCLYYIYYSSDEYLHVNGFDPFAELIAESQLLLLYLATCLFGHVGSCPDMLRVSRALHGCAQRRNCSAHYINDLEAYVIIYITKTKNWANLFWAGLSYAPYVIQIVVMWRVLRAVLSSLGNVFAPLQITEERSQEELFGVRVSPPAVLLTLEQEDARMDELAKLFPNLTKRDARNYLSSRGWSVSATQSYLLMPAGRASMAALARTKRDSESVIEPTRVVDTFHVSRSSEKEVYPPVRATRRTVLPQPRAGELIIGTSEADAKESNVSNKYESGNTVSMIEI